MISRICAPPSYKLTLTLPAGERQPRGGEQALPDHGGGPARDAGDPGEGHGPPGNGEKSFRKFIRHLFYQLDEFYSNHMCYKVDLS